MLAGDYNGDGLVDAADYVVWRRTFGQLVDPGSGADGDKSGDIGTEDYEVWRANYGKAAIGTGTATVVVPEPPAGHMTMIVLTSILALFPHRRRYGALDASLLEIAARWHRWIAACEISMGPARSE